MKSILYYFLFLLLLVCISSCKNKPNFTKLDRIDSLITVNPDSAISILNHIKEKISSKPEATRMYYCLLNIKANDKAYKPHTSNSDIMKVVQYYEKKNDRRLLEAYYYAGRVHSDLMDTSQALHYFHKAISQIQDDSDYALISKIYSQTGTLLLYQDIYSEAMLAFKKAYHYSLLKNDSISIIFNLRDIGSVFVGYGKADSALYYYQEAYTKALKSGQKKSLNMMQGELTKLYTQLKQYDMAKKMLHDAMNNLYMPNKSGLYSIAADLYEQIGDIDSAHYFYHVLLDSGTLYAKQAAHLGLARIARIKHDWQSLMNHIDQYNVYCDSIQKITDTETIARMQTLYNCQLYEKENLILKTQNEQQKVGLLSIILLLITVTAFISIYILYNKQQRAQWKERLRKLEELKEEQYKKSPLFIKANKEKIQELETKQQSNIPQNTSIEELIQAEKDKLLCLNNQIEAERREQEKAIIAFRESNIYLKFHLAHDYTELNEEDWKELQRSIDATFKKFSSRLYSLYPLSEIEFKICLLIKIGISVTNIALLTGRTKPTITSARRKMYEKVYKKKEAPEMWDQFILSL